MFAQDNGEPMHPDSVTDWLSKFSKRHGLPHIIPPCVPSHICNPGFAERSRH